MGSFIGHAIPGLFFIIIALWWIPNMLWKYFEARRKNRQFKSTAVFPCRCCCGKLKNGPTEAYVKILFVVLGTCVEGGKGIKDYVVDNDDYQNNLQHATMILMFGLNAVMDILLHYNFPVPPNSDYITMALAIASEGLLFKFHLHGRTDLDVLVHTLLVYTLVASTASVLLEMKFRHSIMAALSRPYFTIVQGTWFWQTGWILYPPFPWSFVWDEENHGQIMVATTIFIWHLAIDFVIIIGIGFIVAYVQRRFYPGRPGNTVAMKRLLDSESDGEAGVKLMEDESDHELKEEKSDVL